jgi:hypothetical protein
MESPPFLAKYEGVGGEKASYTEVQMSKANRWFGYRRQELCKNASIRLTAWLTAERSKPAGFSRQLPEQWMVEER